MSISQKLLSTLVLATSSVISWPSNTLETYQTGFLDRTNLIGLEHFKKLPDSIRIAHDKYTKNATTANYEAFTNAVLVKPSFLGGVKLLFDATYKTNHIDQLVNTFGSKGYLEGDVPNRVFFQLDYLYLNRLCGSKRIAVHSKPLVHQGMIDSIAQADRTDDGEFTFVISEVATWDNMALTRAILEKLLVQRKSDYRLHTILAQAYLYRRTPIYTDIEGKRTIVSPQLPDRRDLALQHARTAIEIAPAFPMAYYLAYLTEPNHERKARYLKLYVQLERDHTSESYLYAVKKLRY